MENQNIKFSNDEIISLVNYGTNNDNDKEVKQFLKIIHQYPELDDSWGTDRIFNFNKNQRNTYLKLLKPCMPKDELKKLDSILEELNESVINISLLKKTGNMNMLKGRLKAVKIENNNISIDVSTSNFGYSLDRVDLFLKVMNDFFVENDASVFMCSTLENSQALYDYLTEEVKDIFNYCSTIYNIEDADFVTRILNSALIQINDISSFRGYLELAIDYWNLRIKYINETYNLNKDSIKKIDILKPIPRSYPVF